MAGSGGAALLLAENGSVRRASLEPWLAVHPLAPSQNIRAEVIASTAAASAHVVQIRDREAPHVHQVHDAVITLLRGEGAIFLGESPYPMRAGDSLVLPRGVPHYFVNLGEAPAVALVTFAPPFDGTDHLPTGR